MLGYIFNTSCITRALINVVYCYLPLTASHTYPSGDEAIPSLRYVVGRVVTASLPGVKALVFVRAAGRHVCRGAGHGAWFAEPSRHAAIHLVVLSPTPHILIPKPRPRRSLVAADPAPRVGGASGWLGQLQQSESERGREIVKWVEGTQAYSPHNSQSERIQACHSHNALGR